MTIVFYYVLSKVAECHFYKMHNLEHDGVALTNFRRIASVLTQSAAFSNANNTNNILLVSAIRVDHLINIPIFKFHSATIVKFL